MIGTTTIPSVERRMWGMGFSVTWPPSKAVRSPPIFAASACDASWHVVENRKTMYQMTPSARSGVFIVPARRKRVRALLSVPPWRPDFPLAALLWLPSAAAAAWSPPNIKDWLRGLDSNQDNQLQRLACYQLHYPGVDAKSVAEDANSAQRFQPSVGTGAPSNYRNRPSRRIKL